MQTVTLGAAGLAVTPLAYGTWQFGGDWGPVDERAAVTAIEHARSLGINFFDTAQAYGFGRSERLLGQALAADLRSARDSVVIATKGGLRMDGENLVRDSSPAWLRKGAEASLDALRTDHIDLYQVHLLPYASAHNIGVLAYGPLAHGLLGGAITEATTFGPADWRSHSRAFTGPGFARNLEVIGALRASAVRRGATIGQLALTWVLANPAVQVAIVGARTPAHLDESLGALDLTLSQADLAEIDHIMAAAVPVGGPTPEGMS